jgi:DUF4097 and DUF4098 domain-containing protein YvlB
MVNSTKKTAIILALACMTLPLGAADKKEFKYTIAAGSRVHISNDFGGVTLKPASGQQLIITATPSSDKILIDSKQAGNRVEARVRGAAGAGKADNASIEVSVPADVSVTIHSSQGPVTVERVKADITIEGENAKVDVREASGKSLNIRTMNGPVTLSNVSNGTVEVRTVSGNVSLSSVVGPRVTVVTNKGAIKYDGDPGADGDYKLNTHSGDIDVSLPASASVNLEGHSIKGTLSNDFQQAAEAKPAAAKTNSFTEILNAGGSNMELRSFNGKVRVKRR